MFATGILVFTLIVGAFARSAPPALAEYEDAFFVGRTKTIEDPATVVPFDKILVNSRGGYDVTKNRFYPKSWGFYWVTMTAGARRHGVIDYTLFVERTRTVDIYRDAYNHDGNDTASRDIVIDTSNGDDMWMDSADPNGLFSNAGLQTAFGGFRVSDLMNKLTCFSIARYTEYDRMQGLRLEWKKEKINTDLAFDLKIKRQFNVPTTGTYFFTFSVGVKRYAPFRAIIFHNAKAEYDLRRDSTNQDGVDTVSRCFSMKLTKGDTVHIELAKGANVYSDHGLQTAFTGIMYDPKHNQSVYWSVAKTTSWTATTELNPVPYDQVLINQGSGFDAAQNAFVASKAGTYFVSFSAGIQIQKQVSLTLQQNGQTLASLTRVSDVHDGVDVMSRSILVDLKVGDKLSMAAAGNTALFSDAFRQTSFHGFLLYTK